MFKEIQLEEKIRQLEGEVCELNRKVDKLTERMDIHIKNKILSYPSSFTLPPPEDG